jgi:hypothetical protein
MESTSRMKDFFDIYYLSHMFDFDGSILHNAIWQTINHRATFHAANCFQQIRAFIENPTLHHQWDRYQPTIHMDLPSFQEVIDQLARFLEPVFSAPDTKDFIKTWSAELGTWS